MQVFHITKNHGIQVFRGVKNSTLKLSVWPASVGVRDIVSAMPPHTRQRNEKINHLGR